MSQENNAEQFIEELTTPRGSLSKPPYPSIAPPLPVLSNTSLSLKTKIKHGLIVSTEQLFEQALETMKRKNADYSGDNRGMKNFETSAIIANIKMSQGILTRLMDKMARIGNLLTKDSAAVKGETVFDTVQDAINYCAILYFAILIEEEEEIT